MQYHNSTSDHFLKVSCNVRLSINSSYFVKLKYIGPSCTLNKIFTMQEFITSFISNLENIPLSHEGFPFIDTFQCIFLTLYLLISPLISSLKQL